MFYKKKEKKMHSRNNFFYLSKNRRSLFCYPSM